MPNSSPYQWLITMQANQQPAPPDNPPPRPTVINTDPYTLEYPVELGLYLPEDAHWTDAWALTDALLLQFRDVVASSDVPFAAVIIPDRRAVQDSDWQTTQYQYAALRPELWDADPLAPGTRVEKFLTAHNIPVLDMTPALRAWANDHPDERLYFENDGHFNPNGHTVTAGELSAWLLENNLVPR